MAQGLSKTETQLLENLFDSLDRLFDRECQVIEVYAIMFATQHALKPYNTALSLDDYAEGLQKIARNEEDFESQSQRALELTDDLRIILDDLLYPD